VSEPVAYLLGELDDAQSAEFERAMTADPELRAEVERLRPVVTRLERVPAEA
jgi:anti-sigma factor RsiW